MAIFYRYNDAIRGTQSSDSYASAPSGTWSYTGPTQKLLVREGSNSAVNFNGDSTNEEVHPNHAKGSTEAQTVEIDGVERSALYDYSFVVNDGTRDYTIAVIDVDLEDSGYVNGTGEDGYYLIFTDGVPPAGTDLTVTDGETNNVEYVPHSSLGGQVKCFCAGTRILTPGGETLVECLAKGDLVVTRDSGPQPIRWIGRRFLDAAELAAHPDLRPIRIKAGALRPGIPQTDLLVSPQHRIRLSSRIIQRMFGCEEVLIAAKKLLDLTGIEICQDIRQTEYYHLAMDRHELVRSNCAWTETFYPGEEALKSMDTKARAEIEALFFVSTQAQTGAGIEPALPFVEKFPQIRKMVERHIKNDVLICR